MAQSGRSYSAARFAVAIDGIPAGFAVSVSGGERFAEVLERPGTGGLVDKHLGPVQFEPIVLEVGAAPGPALDWVRDALAGAAKAHNGVISLLDYNNRERQRLEWTSGVLAEIGFPTADAADKDSAGACASRSGPSRRGCSQDGTARSARSRPWARSRSGHSNFRLGGRRARVGVPEDPNRLGDHLSPRAATDDVGTVRPGRGRSRHRDRRRHLHRADTRRAGVPGMVRRPRQRHRQERTAQLAFLAPSLKDDLLRIDLAGVGVCRVADVRHVSGSQAIASSEVTMYCESAALASTPQTTAPQPDGRNRVAGDGQHRPGPPRRPPGRRHRRAHAESRELTAIDRRPAARHGDHRASRSGRCHRTGSLARSGLGRATSPGWASSTTSPPWPTAATGRAWPSTPTARWSRFLTERGVLDPNASTPGELDRDDLVAGLAAGAAEVHATVTPLLAARTRGRRSVATGDVTRRRLHPRPGESRVSSPYVGPLAPRGHRLEVAVVPSISVIILTMGDRPDGLRAAMACAGSGRREHRGDRRRQRRRR